MGHQSGAPSLLNGGFSHHNWPHPWKSFPKIQFSKNEKNNMRNALPMPNHEGESQLQYSENASLLMLQQWNAAGVIEAVNWAGIGYQSIFTTHSVTTQAGRSY